MIFNVLAISQPKIVRFSFRKKLLEGENVLFMGIKLANAHGRLLGVLRYLDNDLNTSVKIDGIL